MTRARSAASVGLAAATLLLPAASTAQVTCDAPETVGPLPRELVEASGIVRDPRAADVFWLHNDSGHKPSLYAIDSSGRLIGIAPLGELLAVDVEDIALGPCGAETCIYLGDIGDNVGFRPFITVYRLPLPDLPTGEADDGAATLSTVEPHATLTFRYPDGGQDAESLVVDGVRNDLVILTKGRSGEVRVYSGPIERDEDAEGPETLEFHGVLDIPTRSGISHQATAADLSPDGRWLAIRTYVSLYFLTWEGIERFDPATKPDWIDLRSANEPQGEGLAFDESGKRLYLASEGQRSRPPVLTTIVCSSAD